jgi:hypothetical protein
MCWVQSSTTAKGHLRVRLILSALLCAVIAISAPALAQDPDTLAPEQAIAVEAAALCEAVVFDAQSFDEAVEGKPWATVDPSETGSNLATHAWRSLTVDDVYLMRLPNGGCSFAVEEGEGEAMRALVLEGLTERAAFTLVLQEETRNGRALRYGYCVDEAYPRVASMVVGERRSRPRFVFNLFRAGTPAADFCRAPV